MQLCFPGTTDVFLYHAAVLWYLCSACVFGTVAQRRGLAEVGVLSSGEEVEVRSNQGRDVEPAQVVHAVSSARVHA